MFPGPFYDLLVTDLVHEHHAFNGLLFRYSNVYLLEGYRSISLIEHKEPSVGLNPEECSNVFVVGQCRTEGNYADELACLLNLAHSSADNSLQNRSTRVMQKMDLVDDDQFNQIDISALTRLSSDNVPLFRGCYDNLGLVNLCSSQMHISSQLSYRYSVFNQPFLETTDYFGDQSLHWSDVDNFEALHIECAILAALLAQNL